VALAIGTKVRVTAFNGTSETVTIVRPTKISLPLPGPDWYVVQLANAGRLCMYLGAEVFGPRLQIVGA
jgi:hypothetical protein